MSSFILGGIIKTNIPFDWKGYQFGWAKVVDDALVVETSVYIELENDRAIIWPAAGGAQMYNGLISDLPDCTIACLLEQELIRWK